MKSRTREELKEAAKFYGVDERMMFSIQALAGYDGQVEGLLWRCNEMLLRWVQAPRKVCDSIGRKCPCKEAANCLVPETQELLAEMAGYIEAFEDEEEDDDTI